MTAGGDHETPYPLAILITLVLGLLLAPLTAPTQPSTQRTLSAVQDLLVFKRHSLQEVVVVAVNHANNQSIALPTCLYLAPGPIAAF